MDDYTHYLTEMSHNANEIWEVSNALFDGFKKSGGVLYETDIEDLLQTMQFVETKIAELSYFHLVIEEVAEEVLKTERENY